MSRNRIQNSEVRSQKVGLKGRRAGFVLISVLCFLASGCGVRFDMQDQPRYRAYKKEEGRFFSDHRASRDIPEGTVARGLLKDNKGFHTGKIDNPNPNVQVESTTNAAGNTIVTSFPNDIDEFPMPITRELIDRGESRYNIYCIVCHGPVGAGDGMVVRRGFSPPPTYHDDRLRNAPVGHFFDVISNGWGKMNGYGAVIPAADRWAVVAYIRALQISQNPDEILKMNANQKPGAAAPHSDTPSTHAGGGK